MSCVDNKVAVQLNTTNATCPIGEATGKKNISETKIPVLSCEGACIRGEIARLAANYVSRGNLNGRGCHGEMFTAPRSAMAEWARKANKVVVIDGCFMHCHGRIMKNVVGHDNMIQFDALPMYNKDNKYKDIMLVDEIPEAERKDLARQVADKILANLKDGTPHGLASQPSYGCE